MRYQPTSRLGREFFQLERLRRSRSWGDQAEFLAKFAQLIDREVWRPNHVRGPVLVVGTLYYDRSRRTYTRLIKGVFTPIPPQRILFGYGTKRVEGPLLQMLVDQIVNGKRRKSK